MQYLDATFQNFSETCPRPHTADYTPTLRFEALVPALHPTGLV